MNDSDQLDQALEDLLAGRSPRSAARELDPEEQRMLRVAQLLAGSGVEEPAPEFVESLHSRLFPQPTRLSRRTAFLGGIGTLAAGVLAGLGLDRLTRSGSKKPSWSPLVGSNGQWVAVARGSTGTTLRDRGSRTVSPAFRSRPASLPGRLPAR